MKALLAGKTEAGIPYKVIKRSDGRFAVRLRGGKTVTGDEKLKILVSGGLVKAAMPKKVEEPVAEESAAEEPAAEE